MELNTNICLTKFNLKVTKASIIKNGEVWATRFGEIIILSFYVNVKGTFSNYTSYDLFTITKRCCFDIKSIAMSQSDGKTHVVEITNGSNLIKLSVKGESFKADDWLWGSMTIPTNEK